MTLIGTADIYLGAQNLTIIQLPITAVVPAGSTLVVEVDWPDTSGETGFFMGSNNLGQTAPSYFRSASCGIQEPTNLADIGYSTMHIVMNVTGSVGTPPPAWYKPMSSCIPAEEAPFAFINQPWGWLEGVASPNATIQASLKRGTSTVATASTQADALGWFSMDFLVNSSHTDILVGDRVIVVGGGLDSTITVPDLVGSIDPDQNRVAGQISGVSLPALGDVCVRMPAELNFESGKTWFDANGRFGIDFDGLVDIGVDHLAQVVYEDPNGNYVVQVLYPEGLNPRALINESRVEGVTRPDSQVTVLLRDANGIKGWAEITADKTGFYSTEIFSNGQKVLFALGDQVIVNKPGHTREIILNMHHISHIHPWTDRVFGTIYDANIAAEGSQGRIDVWNAIEKQWYTQYVWIEPDGQYGADFSGIADIQSGAMIRVWATAADGSQQAALGWDLHLGVSTSNDFVWGYTTAGSPVTINLYKSLVGTTLTDLIGTASTTAQSNGYFSAIVMSSGKQVDIIPSNALQVLTNEQLQTLYVGKVDAAIDVELDRLTISGPHNAVVHLEGRRPYFGSYVWREVYLDSNGMAVVDLSDANIWSGDVFDLTCYIVEVGQAVHTMVAAPGLPNRPLYLPLVTR